MATAAALHLETETFQMEVEAAITIAVVMEVAAIKAEATTVIEAEATVAAIKAEATVARTMGTAEATETKEMVTAEATAAKGMAMAVATAAMVEATITMAEDIPMEATAAKEEVHWVPIAPDGARCARFMEYIPGGSASTTRATDDAVRTNATGPSTVAMPLNGSLKIAGYYRRGSSSSVSLSSSSQVSSISSLPRLVFLRHRFLQHPEGRTSTSQPSIHHRLRPSQRRADRTSINPPSERRQPLSSNSKGDLRAV